MNDDLSVLPEYQLRLVKRAQRAISIGSIPTDVVNELIASLVRVWEYQRAMDKEHRQKVLDLEDAIVRLGGGSSADRRKEPRVQQVMRQGGWVDA